MKSHIYLKKSNILDYDTPLITDLIKNRGWNSLDDFEKIGAAYSFVKDEIKFGYNSRDDISASLVLADGYGQCNTKGTLLMTLLRALDVPCRFHGFTIEKSLQKGAIPYYIMWLAPEFIIHSWVEVLFEDNWINLEGFIIDDPYLKSIQSKFKDEKNNFCGYGIATKCLLDPQVEWSGKDTYIQKEGIHDDFGIFNTPDEFYEKYGTNLSGIKNWLYKNVIRHLINKNVESIRKLIN